ncbi:Ceramide glucosyltransferase [Histomonas meleagridis]|uniref:Ceramide glucosyltransferase n=1 Tax=Histomonas meleagridis TaxID=135588 RepID=UPI003559A66F|nr:Ceramide glucosyltransferase [Histomonas meleagridis]KAH0801920.1 Ceramide glucosyltransferase [Histomonas meleagridis]
MGMACFIIVVVAILMIAMALSRKRGLDPSTAIVKLDEYPMITVVMCCKGTHENSLSNFKRNLSMQYPGKVEFLFVAESEDDPAVACARQAIEESNLNTENRKTDIVIAGLSFHNAQKVHNMLFGVAYSDPESKYVLFADDDVFFYPGLIEELVDPLIKYPDNILVSTGYEFIVPPPGGNVFDYCLMIYRLHNLFSFITPRPILCWGGCWMSTLSVFRENFNNLIDCYLDGGYSDDTIISLLVQQRGYVCAHPFRAIFPNVVSKKISFRKYWEFMTRQFFVTDTYATNFNKRVNHSLAFLICSSIWLMIIWISIAPVSGSLAILASIFGDFKFNLAGKLGIVSIFLWIFMTETIKNAMKTMAKVSNQQRPPEQHVKIELNRFKIFLGIAIHTFLMPISVVYIMLSNSIVWAGVRYYKKNGKIVKVERKGSDGRPYSVPFENSIARTLSNPKMSELVNFNSQIHFQQV